MSQWGVQLVIGKLLTDERVRRRLAEQGRECLTSLTERGLDLNEAEIDALVAIDPEVWSKTARHIHAKLRVVGRMVHAQELAKRREFTRRQHQVLRGVFAGLTNKQIAAELHVSESAVKATVQQLFRKTEVRTRAQLVRVAVENDVGMPPEPGYQEVYRTAGLQTNPKGHRPDLSLRQGAAKRPEQS